VTAIARTLVTLTGVRSSARFWSAPVSRLRDSDDGAFG
jgi:hypothetical protein